MIGYLIVVKSQTRAQRTLKALRMRGIDGKIIRVPGSVSGVGCGYCVQIDESDLSRALITLKENDMSPARVLMVYDNGDYREIRI